MNLFEGLSGSTVSNIRHRTGFTNKDFCNPPYQRLNSDDGAPQALDSIKHEPSRFDPLMSTETIAPIKNRPSVLGVSSVAPGHASEDLKLGDVNHLGKLVYEADLRTTKDFVPNNDFLAYQLSIYNKVATGLTVETARHNVGFPEVILRYQRGNRVALITKKEGEGVMSLRVHDLALRRSNDFLHAPLEFDDILRLEHDFLCVAETLERRSNPYERSWEQQMKNPTFIGRRVIEPSYIPRLIACNLSHR